MSIRSKIICGCTVLTLLASLLGIYGQQAGQQVGVLAAHLYDDAFVGVNYLRVAQADFAKVSQSQHGGTVDANAVSSVLADLSLARDRAMTTQSRQAAERLADAVKSAVAHPPDAAAVQAQFESAVQTFAGDGFRVRWDIGALVADQGRETMFVIGATMLGALIITSLLSSMITRPIRSASRIAQSIAGGQFDNAISVTGDGETADLMRALSVMQSSISQGVGHIHGLLAQQANSHAGEMAKQHVRLEAALDNMSHGLCLFGPDGRLAMSNQRFAAMFGAPRADASVETVLHDAGLDLLLGHARDAGLAAVTCELADGRAIAVSRQVLADGGWVATYEDISERRATENRLAHFARHDVLTGLPNRLMLSEHLGGALARVRRGGGLALLSLDLSRFKAVNEALGHAAGDGLLQAVTQRLRDCVGSDDLLVRFGSDEFIIVQERADQPAEATTLAKRLIDAIGEVFEIGQQEIVIAASIGIALSMDGLETGDGLLNQANLALHRAKIDGRGTFRFFAREMDAAMQLKRTLEMDLRRALGERSLEMFYQPLVQADGIVGFEALLRWRHPVRGLVSPADFIPIAEETGLIGVIGAWVLRQACADAASWPGELKVAVNLSPLQFRSRSLVDEVVSALASSGLPARRLELEITESVLIQDDDAAVLETLHKFRAMGIRIAMDDFGTGYSSLSYLRRFPFDKIKIDQSFVQGIVQDEDCRTIVRAVIGLGRSLRMLVNAEGVETEAQLQALRAEGCTEIQGYFFGKPQPASDIAEMLRTLTPEAVSGVAAMHQALGVTGMLDDTGSVGARP